MKRLKSIKISIMNRRRYHAGRLILCLALMLSSLNLMPAAAIDSVKNVITADVFVYKNSPNTNYAGNTSLILGKGRHAYIRLDLTDVKSASEATAILYAAYYKGNKSNTITVVPCSEYLSNGDKDSSTMWKTDNITYNNRPLDANTQTTIYANAFNGSTMKLDVTKLIKEAKDAGKNILSLHITTADVETDTSAVEVYSSRRTDSAPHLDIIPAESMEEFQLDKKSFDDYNDSSSIAQKNIKIKTEEGRYLKMNKDGSFAVTAAADEASVFGVYKSDYDEPEGYSGDSCWTQISYAFKCLDNGKFLTIQNYFAEGDSNKEYYSGSGNTYNIRAAADTVNWNERFRISQYHPAGENANLTYEISSHLDQTRDNGWGICPLRVDGDSLVCINGNTGRARFVFEDAANRDQLEVRTKVSGSTAALNWYPVNGDTNPSHYSVAGGAVPTYDSASGKFIATIDGLKAGTYTYTVSNTTNSVGDTVSVRVFNHPGITHSQADLDTMKAHIDNKEEPWYSDYMKLQNTVPDGQSSYNFSGIVRSGVGRGDPSGSGNISDFEQAGNVAYFNALQWVITGDVQYAAKSEEILNGWAKILKIVDGRDRILGAGINAFKFCNAAEILKYYQHDGQIGYSGYTDTEFANLQSMMLNVIYPVIEDLAAPMRANGNWDTASMVSMIAIGVLCDNEDIYDRATSLYQDIHVNGSIAVYVSDSGQSVESLRDQAHAQLGISYMADVCQVAKSQNDNLYGLYDNRLAKAFNWAAQYNLYADPEPSWTPLKDVFGRTPWTTIDSEKINRGELRPVYELPLAYYSHVKGVDITWMQKAAEAMRAQGYVHNDNLNLGTLTTYNGDTTEASVPYFQIRTRLEPWYQRTWSEVNKYGTPFEGTAETLNSYLALTEDNQLTFSSMKINAPYFQLIDNGDGTYSIKCLKNKKYLSVKKEQIGDDNIIKADADTVNNSEKFKFMSTGAGFYYLSSPSNGNRVVYVNQQNADNLQNAVLTLRLGTSTNLASSAVSNEEKFILIYNTKETVKLSFAKDSLNALIENCDSLDKGKFDSASWLTFQNVLEKAKTVVQKENVTQTEVDDALRILTEAKDNLAYAVDKTLLTKTIAAAKVADTAGCTPDSIRVLTEAMEEAEKLLANPGASKNQVDDMAAKLTSAVVNLKKITKADKTELNAAITAAQALNEEDYTAETWLAVQTALSTAKNCSLDADQTTINSLAESLNSAVAALVRNTQPTPEQTAEVREDAETGVKVEAFKGVIGADVVLYVNKLAEGTSEYNDVKNALKDICTEFVSYDIKLLLDNVKQQPNGKLVIILPIPEGFDRTRLAIYYVSDDGQLTEIPSEIVDDSIRFETNHLSKYVLVEKSFVSAEDGFTPSVSTGDKIDMVPYIFVMVSIAILGVISHKKGRKLINTFTMPHIL